MSAGDRSACPRCGYVRSPQGIQASTATAKGTTPRWPIALGAVLMVLIVGVAGVVWLSRGPSAPQRPATGSLASPQTMNEPGLSVRGTNTPTETEPTPAPPQGDWTQADVDSARVALGAFTDQTEVCGDDEADNGDFWDEVTWGDGIPRDEAMDVSRRSEFARGLAPIVSQLKAFQATPGGQLLQPDVATLTGALATIGDELGAATSQAEFDGQIAELAKAQAVLCDVWAMTFADGTSAGLAQRIEAMQDVVDRQVNSGAGQTLRVEFAVHQGPGDGYFYSTAGDGCTASAGPPMGPYFDLYPSQEIEILDASGTLLDTAVLGTGTLDYESGLGACVFDVAFTGLQDADGYRVGYESRGHYEVTRSELDDAEWLLRIPMGHPYAWSAPKAPPGGVVTGGITIFEPSLENVINAMAYDVQNPGAPSTYPIETIEVTDRGFHVADQCVGSGGYSDLAPGSTVTLLNEKAEVISSAGLQAGWPSETTGMWGGCRMAFTLPNVPDAATYTIQSGRGSLTYTREELDNGGWNIELQIGSSE